MTSYICQRLIPFDFDSLEELSDISLERLMKRENAHLSLKHYITASFKIVLVEELSSIA